MAASTGMISALPQDIVRRFLARCDADELISAADLQGHRWELIFSSAAAKLPLLDGYMPNREVLTWDLERSRLELEIETLPLSLAAEREHTIRLSNIEVIN